MPRFALILTVIATFVTQSAIALPLWELEGTKNDVRLLGSVHLLREQDYPLPRAFISAYEDAEIVVMEADLGQQDPLQLQLIVQDLAIDPRGRNLSDFLSAGAYRQITAKTARINIDISMLQPYEPWFAALQITQLRLMQLGFDMSYGVDMHFTQRAQQDRKRIVGLETVNEQLKLMDSLPKKTQEQFLLQTVEEAEDVEATMNDLLRAWRRGDQRSLEKEMLKGLQDQPELYRKIVVDRNRNWTKKISGFVNDSKDYLIIVGSLHLVGPDSVLIMLEDAGYESHQVRR